MLLLLDVLLMLLVVAPMIKNKVTKIWIGAEKVCRLPPPFRPAPRARAVGPGPEKGLGPRPGIRRWI